MSVEINWKFLSRHRDFNESTAFFKLTYFLRHAVIVLCKCFLAWIPFNISYQYFVSNLVYNLITDRHIDKGIDSRMYCMYAQDGKLPIAPAYIFMIDVSYQSIKSGLVNLLCARMKDVLSHLPRYFTLQLICIFYCFSLYFAG